MLGIMCWTISATVSPSIVNFFLWTCDWQRSRGFGYTYVTWTVSFPLLDGSKSQSKAFWKNSCKNKSWVCLLIDSVIFCCSFKLFEVHYIFPSKGCHSPRIWLLFNSKAEETCELKSRSLQVHFSVCVKWRALLFASGHWTIKLSYKYIWESKIAIDWKGPLEVSSSTFCSKGSVQRCVRLLEVLSRWFQYL